MVSNQPQARASFCLYARHSVVGRMRVGDNPFFTWMNVKCYHDKCNKLPKFH